MSAASALLLFALSASDVRWGLTFRAPDGCIQAAELAERIEVRVGRPMFGAKPDVRIDGYVKAAEAPLKWRARLTLVDADGTVKGSREVTSVEPSCRAIDDSLSLVAAVMLDPAAALKGNPEPANLEGRPLPEPPPPPSSEPAPQLERPKPLLPQVPPREEWPGYVVADKGDFTQNGRWMTRSTFYRIVGRGDLDDAYGTRLSLKAVGYIIGTVGLITGGVLSLVQLTDLTCAKYSGNPSSPGPCVEKSNWPLVSGLLTAGVGLALVVLAAVLPSTPTNDDEDHALAETYNGKLKPPSLPVTF